MPFGCGSKPMVPFWGGCTTHVSLFLWGLGCSLGVRVFVPGPFGEGPIPKNRRATVSRRCQVATFGRLLSRRAWPSMPKVDGHANRTVAFIPHRIYIYIYMFQAVDPPPPSPPLPPPTPPPPLWGWGGWVVGWWWGGGVVVGWLGGWANPPPPVGGGVGGGVVGWWGGWVVGWLGDWVVGWLGGWGVVRSWFRLGGLV